MALIKSANKDLPSLKNCFKILKERSASASSRPRIEDKLGTQSENDEEAAPSETSDSSSNMDDTVISRMKNPAWDYDLGEEEVSLILFMID